MLEHLSQIWIYISFQISIIAQQKQGSLVPYFTSKGHEILLIRSGQLSVNEMFKIEHSDNRWQTWKLRGIGWFILFGSTNCLARILHIISNYNMILIFILYL